MKTKTIGYLSAVALSVAALIAACAMQSSDANSSRVQSTKSVQGKDEG